MKNQYFGDISDYRKYSLIKVLSGYGNLTTMICWMLTPNDSREDGHRINYLREPRLWEQFNPHLFKLLQEEVILKNKREVSVLEKSNFLTNCRYFSDLVPEEANLREKYMDELLSLAKDTTLLFLDPDNGMEIKSVPYGRLRSTKYLYFSEVRKLFNAGKSLLIYQHLPPKPRSKLARDLVDKFKAHTNIKQVYLFWTQFVVFFLLPQSSHETLLLDAYKNVNEAWDDQIAMQVL